MAMRPRRFEVDEGLTAPKTQSSRIIGMVLDTWSVQHHPGCHFVGLLGGDALAAEGPA